MIEEYKVYTNAKIELLKNDKIIIVTSETSDFTDDEFKQVFNDILDLIKVESYEKLIFDKRKMTVFHESSMEWYYLKWKPEAYKYGLKFHRKLLGIDFIFNNSVELCRKIMDDKYPDAEYHKMNIVYSCTLGEAIEN